MFKKDFFDAEVVDSFDLKINYISDEKKDINKATVIIEYYSKKKNKKVQITSSFQDKHSKIYDDEINYIKSRAFIDAFNKFDFLMLKIDQNYSSFDSICDCITCKSKEIYLNDNFCSFDLKKLLRFADYIEVENYTKIKKYFAKIEEFYTFRLKES